MTLPPKFNVGTGWLLDGLQWKPIMGNRIPPISHSANIFRKARSVRLPLNPFFFLMTKNEVLTGSLDSSIIHSHTVIIRGKSSRMSRRLQFIYHKTCQNVIISSELALILHTFLSTSNIKSTIRHCVST